MGDLLDEAKVSSAISVQANKMRGKAKKERSVERVLDSGLAVWSAVVCG
jgi:hypothetical protein